MEPAEQQRFLSAPASSSGSDITAMSAVDLSAAIRLRQVSCREVMHAYLARIDRCNPSVNAIVSLQDPSQLLEQADVRDAQLARGEYLGWMHGMPQAIKDTTATAGIRTTLGSRANWNNIPKTDAVIVERARRSGAIVIGKTNTPEFALGSHTYNAVFGTTLNAYDQTKTAGGSSGGAAVALALRMLPVADGSDMMGSLRNPAAYNNIFGMRPSLGLVPYGPSNEAFYQQLATMGPMARSVRDLAMLLSVQAGPDDRAPLSLPVDTARFTQPLERDCHGVRIGWLGDLDGYLPMESGVMPLCESALQHFRDIGARVEAAQVQFDMPKLWTAWLTLRSFLISGNIGAVYAHEKTRALMKPEAIWEVEAGMKLSGVDVYKASVIRTAWHDTLRKLFDTYDFLVLPSAQVFPFDATMDWPRQIGDKEMDTYHRWMEVVVPATMAGLPAISVPAGFSDTGLPMGLQIIGKPQDDLSVLEVAHAYEQVIPYTKTMPALAKHAY